MHLTTHAFRDMSRRISYTPPLDFGTPPVTLPMNGPLRLLVKNADLYLTLQFFANFMADLIYPLLFFFYHFFNSQFVNLPL